MLIFFRTWVEAKLPRSLDMMHIATYPTRIKNILIDIDWLNNVFFSEGFSTLMRLIPKRIEATAMWLMYINFVSDT